MIWVVVAVLMAAVSLCPHFQVGQIENEYRVLSHTATDDTTVSSPSHLNKDVSVPTCAVGWSDRE